MANSPRPSRRPQLRGHATPHDLPDDTPAVPPPASGDAIDLDFDAPATAPPGPVASVQAFASPDTFLPHDDFFAARDAVLERLGLFTGGGAGIQSAADPDLSGIENVVGVGVGLRFAGGSLCGEPAVKVFVRRKRPLADIDPAARVPRDVDGLPTDVEAVGDAVPYSFARYYPRPARCGASCGHYRLNGAGTLGCVVVLANNRRAILSNNHVLANQNAAGVGDPIVQPGVGDPRPSPVPADEVIARLEDFAPLLASGNTVDAAVAWTSLARVSPEHMTYRLNPTPVRAALGMTVMKNGRATQSTLGTVTDIGFTLSVRYDPFPAGAVFHDQIVIRGVGGPFSRPGDSGSLVVTAGTKQPVALLFAGSTDGGVTYANRIEHVIAKLNIREFVGPV